MLLLLINASAGVPEAAVSRKFGEVVVLEPARTQAMVPGPYVPFGPQQQIDTLAVDDGNPASYGANGDPTWMEAVQLPVPYGLVQVIGLLYYPGNPYGGTPDLTAYVWDDDGSGGLPGTPLFGPQVYADPTYDTWFYIDVSAENITVDSGYLYVGWSDENVNPNDSTTMYWNAFDTAFDGYNYWFDGTQWVYDDFFGGDFLIRAVVEILQDVKEGSASRPVVSPVSGGVLLSVPSGRLEAQLVDISGRLVFKGLVSGQRVVNLERGVYFYRLGELRGKVVVR